MSVIAAFPETKKEQECSCAPCKIFWKHALKDGGSRIQMPTSSRAGCTATLGSQKGLLRTGDRVKVKGHHTGVVRYVGLADDHLIAPEMHVGVQLYDNVYSPHNGVYKGKRFFFCPPGHAAMVKYSEVSALNPIMKKRDVYGNVMFPSYEAVRKKRTERSKKIFEAEEKLRKEYEAKRRAQLERSAKSAPPPRISPRSTKASELRTGQAENKPPQNLQDEYDIAYRDYIERRRRREERLAFSETPEQTKLRQMKKVFIGEGDDKADRMAETLKKLYKAYEDGKVVVMAGGE